MNTHVYISIKIQNIISVSECPSSLVSPRFSAEVDQWIFPLKLKPNNLEMYKEKKMAVTLFP